MDKAGQELFSAMSLNEKKKYMIKKFIPGVIHHIGKMYAGIGRNCLNVERSQGMKLMADILSRLEKLQNSI